MRIAICVAALAGSPADPAGAAVVPAVVDPVVGSQRTRSQVVPTHPHRGAGDGAGLDRHRGVDKSKCAERIVVDNRHGERVGRQLHAKGVEQTEAETLLALELAVVGDGQVEGLRTRVAVIPTELSCHGREVGAGRTVRKRLEIYHSQTKPLVDFYSNWSATGDASAPKVRKVSGVGSVDGITAGVFEALK